MHFMPRTNLVKIYNYLCMYFLPHVPYCNLFNLWEVQTAKIKNLKQYWSIKLKHTITLYKCKYIICGPLNLKHSSQVNGPFIGWLTLDCLSYYLHIFKNLFTKRYFANFWQSLKLYSYPWSPYSRAEQC